jgi:hypothetical protein
MNALVGFHATTIRQLGGKTRLAAILGLDRDAVTKWHVRGIPSRYWHRVEDLAAEAGLSDITAEALERTKPTVAGSAAKLTGSVAA